MVNTIKEIVVSMLPRLVDQMPVIVVLLLIMLHQQYQLNMLFDRCVSFIVPH